MYFQSSIVQNMSLFLNNYIAALGRQEFVFSDLESIVMTWNSSKSSKYTVQIWNNMSAVWEAAHCEESTMADSCATESPRATVMDLKPSTIYYFRIYVSKAAISAPSEPMKTKELGGLTVLEYKHKLARCKSQSVIARYFR